MDPHAWLRPVGRRAAGIVLSLALVCACDDESPLAPIPTLDDLDLALEVTPASPLISEAVTARIRLAQGDAAGALAGSPIAWGWTSDYAYLFDDRGRVEVELQFFAPGEQEVRVRIQRGTQERLLSQRVMVRTGTVDGSLLMITVAAGPFLRGLDQTAFASQRPQRQLELSAFGLARTEMTNAATVRVIDWALDQGFVSADPTGRFLLWTPAGGTQALIVIDFERSALRWNGTRAVPLPGRELHPVTGVHWAGAPAICNWLSVMDGYDPCYTFTASNPLHLYTVTTDFTRSGYRLPTEAEWEKAGRGGLVLPAGANPAPTRIYPWGDDPVLFRIEDNLDGDPQMSLDLYGSQRANVARRSSGSRLFSGPIFGGTLPVGSFPAGRGPYGHDDLFGNAAEWCNDWFAFGYYAEAPGVDPRGPESMYPSLDDFKSLRGDSWYGSLIPGLDAFSVEEGVAQRRWSAYHYAADFLGFRLARTLNVP
jgi:formylglycine-generating enzyme required for sulfatase activity